MPPIPLISTVQSKTEKLLNMHSLTVTLLVVLGFAQVYSSVIPLASGIVAAGPLGGAGPTLVAGPSGTISSVGAATGRLGVGLGVGLGGLGWNGLGGWGNGVAIAPAVSRTIVSGPGVWGGGLVGKGWW